MGEGNGGVKGSAGGGKKESAGAQLGLFASGAGLLLKELQELNRDAMNKLHELKKKAEGSK